LEAVLVLAFEVFSAALAGVEEVAVVVVVAGVLALAEVKALAEVEAVAAVEPVVVDGVALVDADVDDVCGTSVPAGDSGVTDVNGPGM
jgi:hypothetical protein